MEDSSNNNVVTYTTDSMNQMNNTQAQYTSTLYSFSGTTQQHQVHLKHSNIQVALTSCSLCQLVARCLRIELFGFYIVYTLYPFHYLL